MAKHIKNMDEPAQAIQPVLLRMTDRLAEEVYETLNYFLQDYYSGYEPSSYQRTKDFLYSAVKVAAKTYKGGEKASVYIDYESMNNYVNATGYRIETFTNADTNGGLSVRHNPHV